MSILAYVPEMAKYGGMEQHVCLLAERCTAVGIQVTILTTSNSLDKCRRSKLTAFNVTLTEMSCERGKASNARKALWLVSRRISLGRKAWDVVYTNGQSGLSKWVWSFAGRRAARIHHHHTAADRNEQDTWNRQYWSVLRESQRLIACSKISREVLSKGTRRSDVEYYPYITPTLIDASNNTFYGGKRHVGIRMGYFGRLVATKGIELICRLSEDSRFADVHWEVFGSGELYPQSYFAEYPNTTYHGQYRDLEQYRAILQKLDATVLLSRHNEGMPLSLIEAMSAGLPWIATDQGGTREIAMEERNVEIIPIGADYSVCAAIVDALVDRIREDRICRHAQREGYDCFLSPDSSAQLWLSLMQSYKWMEASDGVDGYKVKRGCQML